MAEQAGRTRRIRRPRAVPGRVPDVDSAELARVPRRQDLGCPARGAPRRGARRFAGRRIRSARAADLRGAPAAATDRRLGDPGPGDQRRSARLRHGPGAPRVREANTAAPSRSRRAPFQRQRPRRQHDSAPDAPPLRETGGRASLRRLSTSRRHTRPRLPAVLGVPARRRLPCAPGRLVTQPFLLLGRVATHRPVGVVQLHHNPDPYQPHTARLVPRARKPGGSGGRKPAQAGPHERRSPGQPEHGQPGAGTVNGVRAGPGDWRRWNYCAGDRLPQCPHLAAHPASRLRGPTGRCSVRDRHAGRRPRRLGRRGIGATGNQHRARRPGAGPQSRCGSLPERRALRRPRPPGGGDLTPPAARLSARPMTAILGISAYYHDAAAALVCDGSVVAAAQAESFTRKKHDSSFPQHAIDYCLAEADLTPADLDYVGFYDKPLLTFDRLLETYLAYAPRGLRSYLKAMPLWLSEK